MTPYWPFYGAVAAYGIFVALNLMLGFRTSKTPIRDFSLRHAFFMPIASAGVALIAISKGVERGAAGWGTADVLLYLFFMHYAVGLQLFGVAQRSVSTNLLVSLFRAGRPLTLEELQKSYGGGRSLDCVSESRLAQMRQWGWIRSSVTERGEVLEATPKGRTRVRISGFILGILSLSPLGDGPLEEREP